MNSFEAYLSSAGVDIWADLTHGQVCALCVLWLKANPDELFEAIYQIETPQAIASIAIEAFDTLHVGDRKASAICKMALGNVILDAVIGETKKAARVFFSMRKAWLDSEPTAPDYTKDSELLGARVLDRNDAAAA